MGRLPQGGPMMGEVFLFIIFVSAVTLSKLLIDMYCETGILTIKELSKKSLLALTVVLITPVGLALFLYKKLSLWNFKRRNK
jgi:hypothetical protein